MSTVLVFVVAGILQNEDIRTKVDLFSKQLVIELLASDKELPRFEMKAIEDEIRQASIGSSGVSVLYAKSFASIIGLNGHLYDFTVPNAEKPKGYAEVSAKITSKQAKKVIESLLLRIVPNLKYELRTQSPPKPSAGMITRRIDYSGYKYAVWRLGDELEPVANFWVDFDTGKILHATFSDSLRKAQ